MWEPGVGRHSALGEIDVGDHSTLGIAGPGRSSRAGLDRLPIPPDEAALRKCRQNRPPMISSDLDPRRSDSRQAVPSRGVFGLVFAMGSEHNAPFPHGRPPLPPGPRDFFAAWYCDPR